MNKLSLAVLLAVLGVSGALRAQNDTWEPNNSAAASVPMFNNTTSTGRIAGFGFQLGPLAGPVTQTCNIYEDSVIMPADEDWYSVVAPTTGPVTVHLRQTGTTAYRLVLQILNQAGTLVHAGPSSGTYAQLSTTPPAADRFDGARAQTNVTQGLTYNIKVFYPVGGPPMPTGTTVSYGLTIEWGTPDASEGTYSNNFPAASPGPGPGQEADATPSAPGAANARVLTNRSYNGWDYYIVQLNQPATITFQIENLVPLAPTFNFDVYWVTRTGLLLSNILVNGAAMQGAEDTFANGYPAIGVVNNPRPTEVLTTPPLVPGTYYFHVHCWDLSGGITLLTNGGNYTVRCSITGQTDDTLEGVASNQNDVPGSATTLPAGTTNNLKLLNNPDGGEEDWYKVRVNNGENVEIRLTITAAATDQINIRLYKPNAINPGIDADLIDSSVINNTDPLIKGAVVTRKIVGTWSSVGVNGNGSIPDGDYLVRITQAALLINCGYSLQVTIPGLINIASEDGFEPNDTLPTATAVSSTYLELPRGLTSGLRAMDEIDFYRFIVGRNENVQVTLRYDAGPDIDLDMFLLDMNGGPDFAATNTFSFLGAPDLTTEINPGALVVIQATAGTSWITAGKIAPNTGFIYMAVRRWGTRGARYELNVNVNNSNPMPPLVIDQLGAAPPTIAVPNSTNIAVAVRNQGAFDATLQSLTLKLTHSGGADVTGEYTISNINPSLPEVIPAAQTNPYVITVTATAASTSGTITATVTGTTGTGLPLVGMPAATFILTGGLAPTPRLVYDDISVFGTLKPAGVAFVRATLRNEGTQGGLYENNTINFAFAQAAANVTSGFGPPIGTSPQLPMIVGAGTTVDVVFTFAIKKSVGIGLTSLTMSGGGPTNPANAGQVQFEIKPQFSTKSPPDTGCTIGGSGAGVPFAPPIAAAMLAGIAFFRRRRGE